MADTSPPAAAAKPSATAAVGDAAGTDAAEGAAGYTVDLFSAEALAARTMSTHLLRIHDYRSDKQRDLLGALVKSTRSAAYLATEGLDDSVAELRRNAAAFRESDETFHGLVRLANSGTRHVVERVETLLARQHQLATTAAFCLEAKQKDDLAIKKLRRMLAGAEIKIKVLHEKLELGRSRGNSSSNTLAHREEQILTLRRSLHARDAQITKLESKIQRAEAWSARSEALREKLIEVELQVDKLIGEKSHLKMQLARAQEHLAEEQVTAMHQNSEANSLAHQMQRDFDERIKTLRQAHRRELEMAMNEVSDAVTRNAKENTHAKQRMLDAEAKYDAQKHDFDRVNYRCDVLAAENKSMRQRLNEIEHSSKYKKAGNKFLDAVRAAKAAKAAKAAADAAAALALLQAQQLGDARGSSGPATDAAQDNGNGNAALAESQQDVARDIKDRRDRASRTDDDQSQQESFLGTDSDDGDDDDDNSEASVEHASNKHAMLPRDYMRTRRVPIPVGRLGPTDMYVQAMSYFRPATSAPMVAQVQKMLAERITKAVAEREERVVRAWRYFTMMYTTYRKWRAIAHSPCTITTLVALQQSKMDCRLAKRQWKAMRRKKRAHRKIWDSICDMTVQLTNEVNGISSVLVPSRVDRDGSPPPHKLPAKGGGWESFSSPRDSASRSSSSISSSRGGGGRYGSRATQSARVGAGTEWNNNSVIPWRPSHPAPADPATHLRKRRPGRLSSQRLKHRRPKSARSVRGSDWRREAADYQAVVKGLQTPLDNIDMVLADTKGFHFDQRLKKQKKTTTMMMLMVRQNGGVGAKRKKKRTPLLVPSRPSTADGTQSRVRRRRKPHS
jgi:hypothetical protein